MAKKLSKRQRLKRDPANQPLDKMVSWAKKQGLTCIALPGLLHIERLDTRDDHPIVNRARDRREKKYERLERLGLIETVEI